MTTFQMPAVPRVLSRVTPDKLELIEVLCRERRKRIRYLGSFYQHYNDRLHVYIAQGGKKGSRYIVEKHHHRAQFCHPGDSRTRYNIRSIKFGGAQYDQLGNFTRMSWDLSLMSTNPQSDPQLRRHFSNINKQEAIDMVEEWGVRYVLLDEVRKPSLMDSKYHRHALFAHKFHWSPDPPMNHRVGDADFKWKGEEHIPYDDFSAHTPEGQKSNFRFSLWRPEAIAKAAEAATKAAAAAAATKATPAAPKKKAPIA